MYRGQNDLHSDVYFLRRFDAMADDFQVCVVSFAIEHASSFLGTQPLTVNVYGLAPGADFTFANLGAADRDQHRIGDISRGRAQGWG